MEYVSDEYVARFFVILVTLKPHCTKKTVESLVLGRVMKLMYWYSLTVSERVQDPFKQ